MVAKTDLYWLLALLKLFDDSEKIVFWLFEKYRTVVVVVFIKLDPVSMFHFMIYSFSVM